MTHKPARQSLPLIGIAGISWFSLQVGERRADLAQAPVGGIVDLADGLKDFAETAAADQVPAEGS